MNLMMMNDHNKKGYRKASRHPHTIYDFITKFMFLLLYFLFLVMTHH
jgi:hypothetical protein